MNSLTDQQLLREYAERRSEAAFTELVRRHVDLVYSAALRMVCDSHLAEDVTQGAFVALAQSAPQLIERAVVSGWLHRTAQNIAAQAVRTDVRRRAREQEAAAMNELLANESDAAWEHIAPHLDAALGELSEADRDALMLRYFERKSAQEMAQVLGVSGEAAQKRVSRAVERLREFFAKRGVTVGASGLLVAISVHAVRTAPAGLGATISSTTGVAGATLTAVTTTTVAKTIVMTTLQKASITAVILALGVSTTLVIQHRAHVKANALSASQSANQSKPSPQTEFPQASWKFAGYTEPEAGFQSIMWAMSQGNVEVTLDSLTPAARAKWERNMTKPKAEIAAQWAERTKQTERFRILDKQSVSEIETHLRIESIGSSNEDPLQKQWARMIKVGTDWKFEGWVGN